MTETEVQDESVESEIEQVEPVKIEEPKAAKPRTTKPVIKDSDDAILELRRENERLRKRFDKDSEERAEKLAVERIETAKREAKEDAQKLLDAHKAEIDEKSRARIMKTELKAAATRAGVIDFDDLFDIMKRDTLKKLDWDADGDITNANDLIAEMKDKKAHLFGGVSTSSTMPAPSVREQKGDKLATEMDKKEYKKALERLYTL